MCAEFQTFNHSSSEGVAVYRYKRSIRFAVITHLDFDKASGLRRARWSKQIPELIASYISSTYFWSVLNSSRFSKSFSHNAAIGLTCCSGKDSHYWQVLCYCHRYSQGDVRLARCSEESKPDIAEFCLSDFRCDFFFVQCLWLPLQPRITSLLRSVLLEL